MSRLIWIAVVLGATGVGACSAPAAEQAKTVDKPPTTAAAFGKLGDTPVQIYTLTNKNGLVARITNYGATLTELHVPDRAGTLADVVLGFDDLDGYRKGTAYFGAIVGRVANRIMNASFELEGQRYSLAANDRPHHLHGGPDRLGQGHLERQACRHC
jgi:aldose 1-epimerase